MADDELSAQQLLQKLDTARDAGLTKAKLFGKKIAPEMQAALDELLARGEVANTGTESKPRFILTRYQKDPAEEFLAKLEAAGETGLTKAKLAAKATAAQLAALESLLLRREIVNAGSEAKPRYILGRFYKEPSEVLAAKLREAGAAGMTKAQLAVKKGSAEETALDALLENRKIANLGTARSPRFVLIEFFKPLEAAYAQIDAKATPGVARIYTRAELAKGLTGVILENADEAIRLLVREKRLIRALKGTATCYLYAASIEPLVYFGGGTAAGPVASALAEIPVNRVREAYDALVLESGFSDVLISHLQKRSAVSWDVLKPWLLEQSREGRAFPSLGDWSLSDPEDRAAALEIRGEPHLRVRLS